MIEVIFDLACLGKWSEKHSGLFINDKGESKIDSTNLVNYFGKDSPFFKDMADLSVKTKPA